MKFSELTLDPRLQQAIDKLGYLDCTPVQEQCIPHVLEGRDVAGLAQTGTGKTAAFLLPLIERILRSIPNDQQISAEEREKTHQRVFKDWQARDFILVLVPTRELADQVFDNLNVLTEFCGLKGVSIYGGTGYDKQKEGLRNNPQFIIATPGRMIDLYKDHHIDLKQVRGVVFDEADRMFDMGFKDDMVYILQRIPRERQFLVFSATLNFDVLNTAYQFGAEPVEINVSRDQAKAENVKDYIYHAGSEEKPQHLLSLLKKTSPKQAIVFTNFKFSVERIAKFLNDNGVQAMAISSLLSQAQRSRVMQQFKAENNMNILVATDVAARGLDIQGVDLVVNYELPNDPESYVHRIGRTGRAGASGIALSLVGDKDVDSLMRIEEYLKHKVPAEFLEEADLIKEFKKFSSEDYSYRPEGRDNRSREPRRDRPPRGGDRGARPRDNRQASGPRDQRPGGETRGPRNNNENRPRPQPRPTNGSGPNGGAPKSAGARPQNSRSATGEGRANDSRKRTDKPRPRPILKPILKNQPPPAGIGAKVKGFFKKLLS